MKKQSLLFLSAILLILLTACGQKEYKPSEINEAIDKCEICNMQVANDKHATQIVTTEGRSLKFDDIGCLFEWKVQNGTETIGEQFVRDYHSLEWIKLSDATYVYDETFKTPMAYGIYSFKEKAEAEKFIAEQNQGVLLSAADLDSHSWEGHSHGDGHGHGDEGHGNGDGHETKNGSSHETKAGH